MTPTKAWLAKQLDAPYLLLLRQPGHRGHVENQIASTRPVPSR
ncbi:hypothetical protein [Streptomyces lydicus]